MSSEYKGTALRAYVYDTLNGEISYNGSTVPVANRAYAGISYPHIIISLNGSVEVGDKDFFGAEYSLVTEVVDRFPINEGGQDSIDDISNSITFTLGTRGNSRRFGNSFMVSLRFDSDVTREEEDEEFRYEYRIIRWIAEIHQDGQGQILQGSYLQGGLQLNLNGS